MDSIWPSVLDSKREAMEQNGKMIYSDNCFVLVNLFFVN